MGLGVPGFAVAFNALLWLSRAGLSPVVARRAGGAAGWLVAVLAPLCLLALVSRMRLVARDPSVLVAALSLALAGLLSGL